MTSHRPPRKSYSCVHCGKTFYRPMKGRDLRRYCSRTCAGLRRRVETKKRDAGYRLVCAALQAARPCDYCHEPMGDAKGLRHAECSAAQKRVYASRLYVTRRITLGCGTARPCAVCGVLFTPPYSRGPKTLCSDQCRASAKQRHRRIGKSKRRAAARNGERIDPLEVFARDHWRCQLCGVATPIRLRGTTHGRAPELDHVMPLALGGQHTWANVQCACRNCNTAKGATALGQFGLPMPRQISGAVRSKGRCCR